MAAAAAVVAPTLAATLNPLSDYEIADRLRYLTTLPDNPSEAKFLWVLCKLANDLRLPWYHTKKSRESRKGFPDWVAVGPGGLVIWELKVDGGRVEPEQEIWDAALERIAARSNGLIYAGIRTPADYYLDGPIPTQLGAIARTPKNRRPAP